ncbi:restriction endonuclease subunit S, partial [Enterobacter hormaechei]
CITIAANIAETAILGIDACFPDSVVGFIPQNENISVEYIEFFFRTVREDLDRYAPATAQKNINLAILETVSVPLMSVEEQRELVLQVTEK